MRAALRWAMSHRKTMGLITLLIVVSPVPLFVLKLAKVDPFPQEASRVLMIDYHIKGSHPMDAGRAGRAPRRGVPAGEQGALRHRDVLLGLAERRGAARACT